MSRQHPNARVTRVTIRPEPRGIRDDFWAACGPVPLISPGTHGTTRSHHLSCQSTTPVSFNQTLGLNPALKYRIPHLKKKLLMALINHRPRLPVQLHPQPADQNGAGFGLILTSPTIPIKPFANTKNFHEHLRRIHNLKDPKRPKAVGVYSMDTYLETSKLVKQPELTAKSLKSTIVLFLAECNLSFSLVKKKSFLRLLVLLNDQAESLLSSNLSCSKLLSITTDNVLTNNKMAEWVKKEIPTFNHKEDLLGCVAHVINLAAKAALATLWPINQEDDDEELPTSMMDL
ncbi:hypothetical protein VP01_2608g2 [Puccinia sorghi]|uniref:HAT C-terminal dimerisation domain-containing protein n=1 Tax=Puccinia sorghi TaxID=27349 RepID=A0A0L6V6D1_9BASI|nr:hypothetical protein VP01_2608g2 [Puccinia sorghi]